MITTNQMNVDRKPLTEKKQRGLKMPKREHLVRRQRVLNSNIMSVLPYEERTCCSRDGC